MAGARRAGAAVNDCAAPRHDGEREPTQAAPSAWLCRSCTFGLRRDLYALPGRYAAMEELLDPRHAGDTHGGGGDGLPVSEAAVEWRHQVVHDLHWWTAEIASLARAAAPADTRVPALAGWLHAQVHWFSFRPAAGDMAGTFAELSCRARAITDPRPVSRFPIPGDCPKCGTPRSLQAALYRDPRDAEWTAVTCTACGHGWDSEQLRRLGRYLTERTAA